MVRLYLLLTLRIFWYLHAFVDQFNVYSLLFYIINGRFLEHPEITDSVFQKNPVGNQLI